MFASETTETVTIGTNVVTIQKLPWIVLDEAARIVHDDAMMRASSMAARASGLAAALAARAAAQSEEPKKDLSAPGEERPSLTDAEVDRLKEIRYQQYDRMTVLRGGVQKWTAAPKLPDAVAGLIEEAASLLHRRILDLSLPSIDPVVREIERKND